MFMDFFAKIVIFLIYIRKYIFFLVFLLKNDNKIWSDEIFFVTLQVEIL